MYLRSPDEALSHAITEIITQVCSAQSKRLHICRQETIDHISTLLFLRFRHRITAVDLQVIENRRKLVFAAKRECLKYRQRTCLFFTSQSRKTANESNLVRESKRVDFDFSSLSDESVNLFKRVEMVDACDFILRRSELLLTPKEFVAVRRFVDQDSVSKNDYKLRKKAFAKLASDPFIAKELADVCL